MSIAAVTEYCHYAKEFVMLIIILLKLNISLSICYRNAVKGRTDKVKAQMIMNYYIQFIIVHFSS